MKTFIKDKINKDVLILIGIAIAYFISFFVRNTPLNIIIISIVGILIFITNDETSFLIVLSSIPMMDLFGYSNIEFFSNLLMLLFLLKTMLLVYFKHIKLNYYILIGIVILSIYNFGLYIAYDFTKISDFIDVINFSTNILGLYLIYKTYKLDLNHIFKTLFYFLLLSCLIGFIRDVYIYGFPFYKSYRFVALMRDANYLSSYLIILLNMYFIIYKKIKFEPLIILFIGFLTVSKMFLLTAITSILIYLILYGKDLYLFIKNKFKPRDYIYLTLAFLLLGILFTPSIIKFIHRLSNFTLTSGRTVLWTNYFNHFISNPKMLLGASTNYRFVYNIGYTEPNQLVHNTFFDVVLSFGVLGIILLILLAILLYKNYKLILKKENIALLVSLTIILNSLSWLNVDNFYFLLLIIILVINSNNNPLKEETLDA